MSGNDDIYDQWLKAICGKQTKLDKRIDRWERELSEAVKQLARSHKGSLPELLDVIAVFFQKIAAARKDWKFIISSSRSLGDKRHSLGRKAAWSQRIYMLELSRLISETLDDAASTCQKSSLVLKSFARETRILAITRAVWLDAETEIGEIIEDPQTPYHREKMQRMIQRCEASNE